MQPKIFRPSRRGAAAVLGPLEGAVMDIAWAAGSDVSVSDVAASLRGRGKKLAYSTVKTVLTNLADKGHLRKIAAGRANIFRPRISKEEFEDGVVSEVLSGLLRSYKNPMLAHLAQELSADPAGIAEFERLLADRRKKGRRE